MPDDTNMVPRSRLEVNFLRVFHETQQMASGIKTKDWTFEKQVEWLEEKLPEMEKSPCAPRPDALTAYRRQLQLLRGVLEADRKSLEPEGAPLLLAGGAAGLLPPPAPADSPSSGAESSSLTQQIHHRTRAQVTARLRRQLLGDKVGEAVSPTAEDGGCEERLARDERRRERLLDDMLAITSQWKEQSRAAGDIIKRDIQTLDKSEGLADCNQSRLKTEAERLNAFNQRACNCWIWIMLLLVCFAFISMVLFIKIFPKRRMVMEP